MPNFHRSAFKLSQSLSSSCFFRAHFTLLLYTHNGLFLPGCSKSPDLTTQTWSCAFSQAITPLGNVSPLCLPQPPLHSISLLRKNVIIKVQNKRCLLQEAFPTLASVKLSVFFRLTARRLVFYLILSMSRPVVCRLVMHDPDSGSSLSFAP